VRLETITIMIEPPRVSWLAEHGRQSATKRQFQTYDQFAEELRRHAEADVTIVEDFLRAAPRQGVVLLDPSTTLSTALAECDAERRNTLPRRTVLLNADRSHVMPLIEEHSLAGAIEKHRYFLWRTDPEHESGGGLYGVRSVAERMGAHCISSPGFPSERYCILSSGRYADLPSLLVGYLETYVRTLGDRPSGCDVGDVS
jgi:hypothetical protein